MAFLTIIAPLVAMTYPIDKITDGKAQAFNMWLKEYIFNLLIQPMHLILYTVLVTSAFKLASENIIYSLVAIGFMVPAEKLLRKFFGFEKAQTPGLLAGPAGAAITMEAMKHLFGKPPKGMDNKANSKSDGESSSDDAKQIKQKMILILMMNFLVLMRRIVIKMVVMIHHMMIVKIAVYQDLMVVYLGQQRMMII